MKQRQAFVPGVMAALLLTAAAALAAPPAAPRLTLEQAVAQVQRDTGGKVLSAEPRKLGHRTEYRIKVLTPEGHVRVIVVSSKATSNPTSTSATKIPAAQGPGNKEKH